MYSNNIIIMLLCEQGAKEELKSTFTGDLNEQMTVFLPRRRIINYILFLVFTHTQWGRASEVSSGA